MTSIILTFYYATTHIASTSLVYIELTLFTLKLFLCVVTSFDEFSNKGEHIYLLLWLPHFLKTLNERKLFEENMLSLAGTEVLRILWSAIK